MSTILWSSLTNGQVVAFDPNSDALSFNSDTILASHVVVQTGASAGTTTFTYSGKTVTLQTDLYTLTTTNVVFANPTILVVGDNTTGTGADNGGRILTGGASFDRLIGGAGADTLDGAEGGAPISGQGDVMVGRAGNDTYFVDELDQIVELPGEGTDTAFSRAGNYTLADNIENLTLVSAGGFATMNGTGNAGANVITGNGLANTLSGLAGNDRLDARAGDDFLRGGAGADVHDGGTGLDFAMYDTAAAGIIVSLGTPAMNTGDAVGDTYTGVEGLVGSSFADLLIGNAGANVLEGGDGNDELRGGDGDDTLHGGAGADKLDGGAGLDYTVYDDAPSAAIVNLTSSANGGAAAGDTFASIEGAIGTSFSDTLIGNNGRNDLVGRDGNDYLQGRGGDDTLTGGFGRDALEGSAGADRLDGGMDFDYARYNNAAAGVVADLENPAANAGEAAGDTYVSIEGIVSSRFNDALYGDFSDNDLAAGDGNDSVSGRGGRDNLQGQGGNDGLDGGAGGDRLNGGEGTDSARYETAESGVLASLAAPSQNKGDAAGDSYVSIEGLAGSSFDDTLIGNDSTNSLLGLDGNDYIQGRGASDTLSGGNGNDRLEGGAAGDSLIGGDGVDYAAYGYAAAAVTVSLATPSANTGEAAGDTYSSIEGIIGSRLNDQLTGDNGINDLAGNTGNDVVNGRGGNDNLQGQNGNDTLDGGAGRDTLRGGDGNDTFVFHRGEADRDTLMDFAGNGAAVGDRLVFQGYGAGATFVQVDATHWTVSSGDGLTHESLAFANGASVHASDYTFI